MSNNSDCAVFGEIARAGQVWRADHKGFEYTIIGVREDGHAQLDIGHGCCTYCDEQGVIYESKAKLTELLYDPEGDA